MRETARETRIRYRNTPGGLENGLDWRVVSRTPQKSESTQIREVAPRRVAGVQISELPLSPEDAFIWSQLDGRTHANEVSELTGMDESAVRDTLQRLEQLGAVHYTEPPVSGVGRTSPTSRRDPRREATQPPPPVDRMSEQPMSGPRSRDPRRDPTERPPPARVEVLRAEITFTKPDQRRDPSTRPTAPKVETKRPRRNGKAATIRPGRSPQAREQKRLSLAMEGTPAEPAPAAVAAVAAAPAPAAVPAELATDIELSDEQRQRIDALFEQLEIATHYQLLGIDTTAQKKDVKAAYFELIAFYHPDKFFRKELGEYKRKLEQIFQRLTEANDVLTRKGPRAEYDEYLDARQATRVMDAIISSIPPPPPRSVAPEAPQAAPPAADAIQLDLPPLDPVESISVAPRSESTPHGRSQALARRLSGGANSRKPEMRTTAAVAPVQIADSLRRMMQSRRSPQLTKFMQAGKDAMAEGAWVSAVNALRIALTLAPDDDEVRALYEEADEKAAGKLAGSYESRARYEEKNGEHDAAAQSWERVANARKQDDKPLRRAAECYANTSEPKRGIAPAREAVQIAPTVENRVVLAKVYEVCGMVASAVGEVNRALETKRDDPELKALLARLQLNK